jgi:hypothetical protein
VGHAGCVIHHEQGTVSFGYLCNGFDIREYDGRIGRSL